MGCAYPSRYQCYALAELLEPPNHTLPRYEIERYRQSISLQLLGVNLIMLDRKSEDVKDFTVYLITLHYMRSTRVLLVQRRGSLFQHTIQHRPY